MNLAASISSDKHMRLERCNRHAGAGGLGALQPPTFLLMYDIKIEAFDPNRKYISFFRVKVHSLLKVSVPESSGPIGGK